MLLLQVSWPVSIRDSHNKRQQKRRLIQPEFVGLLATRLAPGGYLHCATDWEDYAMQMLAVLSAHLAILLR